MPSKGNEQFSDLALANQKLLQKQQLIKIERMGELTNIITVLESGDVEKARHIALSLRDQQNWDQIVAIFRKLNPWIRCKCGDRAVASLNENSLTWEQKGTCFKCANSDRRSAELKEREAFIQDILRKPEYVLELSGVPEIYRTADRADFNNEFDDIWKHNGGFYIYGPDDVVNTHLAAALIKINIAEIVVEKINFKWTINENSLPLFVTASDLILDISSATTPVGSAEFNSVKTILNNLCSRRLVIINDFFIDGQPPWILLTLFSILDRRYRTNKRTIITSRKTLMDIKDIDIKIAGRIAGMCKLRRLSNE